jgi:RHS repeat-associated protein
MNRKLNLANIALSILIGLTLILSAINPTAAYASAPAVKGTRTPPPTATQVVTATPIPTITPPSTNPALALLSDPTYITPGGQVTISYQILNFENIKGAASLRFYIPFGLAPADTSLGKYDEANGTFDLPVSEAEGKTLWQADATIAPPVTVSAELLQDGQAISKAEVTLDELTEFTVEATGGEADGMSGRVRVTFPAGAVSETVKVKVTRPSAESLPVQSLSGAPFELTATAEKSQAEVSRFSAPVQIVVSYSDAGMTDDSSTTLYWYDPSDGQWKLPLSQKLDTENNLIYATTDHFTVFDTYTSNWESAETPTMSFFQTPGFTGSASFSMPIKVPAGPGGLQPSLSLSYSSSTVDNVSSESQASWAGMGWSIAESYIEHNNNGTQGDGKYVDDTYQLSLNGTSIRLFRDANGVYHSEDEQFYKVERSQNDDSWTVWDKSGTKYTFGLMTPQFSLAYEGDRCYVDQSPWRWSLSEVRNIYGQTMTYSYVNETKNFTACAGSQNSFTYTYPQAITYAGGRYRVYFDRLEANETGHRTDLKSIWFNVNSYQSFQQSLLQAIRVEQDADGNGTFETLIRKYQFTYCNSSSCSIFPDLVWDQGGRTPTLLSVQEFGLNGSDSLPAYTFNYADKMHLTSATNGYGGGITYIYNNQTNYTQAPHDAWHDTEGNPQKFKLYGTDSENWTNLIPSGDPTVFNIGTATTQNNSIDSFQPGHWYKLVVRAKATAQSGTHTLELGYSYRENGTWASDYFDAPVTLTQNWATYESQPFFLPVNATAFRPKIRSVKSNQFDWIYLTPLTTVSRVTSRTLSSGADNYTFTYDYVGAATNNPTISAAAAGPHPYDPAYSSFRGHSQVTETDPYGNQTITTYNQDDIYNGRSSSVTIKDYASGLKTLQVTTTTYGYSQWAAPTLTDVSDKHDPNTYNQPYDALYCRYVYTSGDTKDVYGLNPNVSVGTLTTNYAYDSYGNQITKTQTGGGVTLVTHTDYFPNVNAWLVGLPARTWVTDGTNLLTESLNLYDGANLYTTAPTVGIPTATRSLISGTQYSQTSMTRDAWGNAIAQTSYTGYGSAPSAPTVGARTSTTTYDTTYHTYAVATTDALNHTTTVTYDYALGLPVSETDPNGATTSVTYDSLGRFLNLTKPNDSSPSLRVAYQNSPFVVTLQQDIDATHTFTVTRSYDGLGRQATTNTNGVLVTSTFNAFGKPLTQSTPHTSGETAYFTTTTYDALGRALSMTAPDGTVTTSAYNGFITTVTDAKSHSTVTVADVWGRTASITPPATADNSTPPVTFTYDPLGNMKTATRGGAMVELFYDNAGRKTDMHDPDLGNWHYEYNALGGMISQVDARNCTTTIDYDALNRPLTKTYSGSGAGCSAPTVTYTYDTGTSNAIGRRVSMGVSGGDFTSWTYDIKGHVVSENKSIPGGGQFITSFTYNQADLPVTMTYPGDNEVVTFGYNNNMQPVSVTGASAYAQSMAYDSASRMIQLVRGANKLNSVFTYNAWNVDGGRLLNTTTTRVSDSVTLQNSTYDYDSVGNINTIADALLGPQTQTFYYDALDRVTNSAVTGGTDGLYSEGYTFETGTGNLKTKNGGATYNYDTTHKHAVASVGSNTYGYDANGNMTSRYVNGQNFTLNYDAENRLVSVTGASTANFYYDADGKQVKTVVNGVTTYYVGNHYEVKNSVVTKYYFAGATRLAVRTNGTLSYLLGDHIGSSSVTTDANGVKTASALYKAFGETRFSSGNLGTDYKFTGQREEASLGIYFFNARWFDPSLGRFTSPDTIVPTSTQGTQAWDRYAFVNNNPVRYNDPTGHDLFPWNTFTFSIPVFSAGLGIPGFGGSISFGLKIAIDLRPVKTFVENTIVDGSLHVDKVPSEFAKLEKDYNWGVLGGASFADGAEIGGSATLEAGVTTQTMEELAGVGGAVAGEASGTATLCIDFCGGITGSLDSTGDVSVSGITGIGESFEVSQDIITIDEWLFWKNGDGDSCSHVPGAEYNGDCPGQ